MLCWLSRLSFRLQSFIAFLGCAGLVGYAIYAQETQGLSPCSLCISQRIAYALVGLVFLVAVIHGPKKRIWRYIYGLLGILASLSGLGLAARQLWLQYGPHSTDPVSCGPSFAFLEQTQGILAIFKTALLGTGDCAKIDWVFLGISMPGWSALCFVALAIYSGCISFKKHRA